MSKPEHLCLVISSQRSGSTMLCADLARLGKMGVPSEYFWPITDKTITCPNDIRKVIKQGCKPSDPKHAGIKVMLNYLPPITRALNQEFRLPPGRPREMGISEREDYHFEAARKFVEWCLYTYEEVSLFILVRNRSVEQAISRVVARNSGIYHLEPGGCSIGQAEVMIERIPSWLLNLQILEVLPTVIWENRVLRRLQSHFGSICCSLTYEELVRNQPETAIRKVSDYSGRDKGDVALSFSARSTKKIVTHELAARLTESFRKFTDDLCKHHA